MKKKGSGNEEKEIIPLGFSPDSEWSVIVVVIVNVISGFAT